MRFFEGTYAERTIKLDALDKNILAALALNARSSQSTIARKVQASRDTVNYRITRLKKSGVLQAFRTVVDITRLGYVNAHLFLQLKQPTREALGMLLKKLKANPHIRTIIQFTGKYDLELALVAKDLTEIDGIVGEICTECSSWLQHYEIIFITKALAAHTFPESFIHNKTEKEKVNIKKLKTAGNTKVDDTDIMLLEALADNAIAPAYFLAQHVGLSADAVAYRIKKLQKDGYIQGFVPAINYSLINYQVHALLLRVTAVTPSDVATIEEFLHRNKNVLWAVKTLGRYHLLLYLCTQKPDDVTKTTESIRSLLTNKIADFELLINSEQHKYTYLPKGLLTARNSD